MEPAAQAELDPQPTDYRKDHRSRAPSRRASLQGPSSGNGWHERPLQVCTVVDLRQLVAVVVITKNDAVKPSRGERFDRQLPNRLTVKGLVHV